MFRKIKMIRCDEIEIETKGKRVKVTMLKYPYLRLRGEFLLIPFLSYQFDIMKRETTFKFDGLTKKYSLLKLPKLPGRLSGKSISGVGDGALSITADFNKFLVFDSEVFLSKPMEIDKDGYHFEQSLYPGKDIKLVEVLEKSLSKVVEKIRRNGLKLKYENGFLYFLGEDLKIICEIECSKREIVNFPSWMPLFFIGRRLSNSDFLELNKFLKQKLIEKKIRSDGFGIWR